MTKEELFRNIKAVREELVDDVFIPGPYEAGVLDAFDHLLLNLNLTEDYRLYEWRS